MTTAITDHGLRRTTGGLFVAGALAFAGAATVLSSTFDWPDILREPADVVLPAFVAGGTSLVWTWFATAWTYAILLVPILLLPTVLGRRGDPVLRVATYVGATSVVLSLIGFLRWVFVVPPLADSYVGGDAVTRAAVDAAWTAQHQFGGALLGEHLGQLFAVAWSVARQRDHPPHAGPAPLARRRRARRERAVPDQPGRHPGHRRARLPGLGPRRLHRQHRLGTVGRRPGRDGPAAAGPPGDPVPLAGRPRRLREPPDPPFTGSCRRHDSTPVTAPDRPGHPSSAPG